MQNRFDTIHEVNYDYIQHVEKFNPYHGKDGRFTSANGAAGGAVSGGFSTPSAKSFATTMAAAKASIPEQDRWRVDVHEVGDYKKDKLYTSKGGSCVAVEPDGNIISVCKKTGDKTTRGSELLKQAVDNGGDRLDAFGGGLYSFYTKNGFEPVSWTKFDEQYAPDGWVKGRDLPEPIVFYKYTGKTTSMSYNDFLNTKAASPGYDEAYSERNNNMGANK